jgi:hypothetical protein
VNTNTILTMVTEPVKFIGKITTMGKGKVIIYVPLEFHSKVIKGFKGKHVKVTIEDAIG